MWICYNWKGIELGNTKQTEDNNHPPGETWKVCSGQVGGTSVWFWIWLHSFCQLLLMYGCIIKSQEMYTLSVRGNAFLILNFGNSFPTRSHHHKNVLADAWPLANDWKWSKRCVWRQSPTICPYKWVLQLHLQTTLALYILTEMIKCAHNSRQQCVEQEKKTAWSWISKKKH